MHIADEVFEAGLASVDWDAIRGGEADPREAAAHAIRYAIIRYEQMREKTQKVTEPGSPTREQIVDVLVMSPLSDTAGTELGPFNVTADALYNLIHQEN